MSRYPVGIVVLIALLSGCAGGISSPELGSERMETGSITKDRLQRFRSREEFDAYLTELHRLARDNDLWWAIRRAEPAAGLLAQEGGDLPCVPGEPGCELLEEAITVTGSRAVSQSITNNQEAGVDEGDIVKLYENFLIVLQDGRLFSVSIGDSPAELLLVDRIDIYSSPSDHVWYDELLISGNKLVVTGYNYGDDLTEISVFGISDEGLFEWLSTYETTSDDYYSSENYATRMVEDHLVIYTPLYLAEYDLDDGVVFPVYRQRNRDGESTFWQPLFSATDVYWPIQETLYPVVHAVSVCPISADDGLACRSFGAIGPDRVEWYVSPEHAYLWVAQNPYELQSYWNRPRCIDQLAVSDSEAAAAIVYRVPLDGRRMSAARAVGVPRDQFALDAREDRLLALLNASPTDCRMPWSSPNPMRLAEIPLSSFGATPRPMDRRHYTNIPPVRSWWSENRFTESHVAYTTPADPSTEMSDVIVVSLEDAQSSHRISLSHDVERLEILGDGLVATGYLTDDGLHLSSIVLSDPPAVADTEFLPGYFESEGRSHAFNWQIGDEGRGVFGIPVTVKVLKYWGQHGFMVRRARADIGFFEVQADLSFSFAGLLESTEPSDPDYECMVSCEDWYGNARPIFLDDRVFALSGTELMEGRLVNGSIQELGRVQLTGQPAIER